MLHICTYNVYIITIITSIAIYIELNRIANLNTITVIVILTGEYKYR